MVSIVAQTSRVKTARTIDLHLKGEQSAFVEVSTFGNSRFTSPFIRTTFKKILPSRCEAGPSRSDQRTVRGFG